MRAGMAHVLRHVAALGIVRKQEALRFDEPLSQRVLKVLVVRRVVTVVKKHLTHAHRFHRLR